MGPDARQDPPGRRELARTWLRIAALSVGGPAAQIAAMHRVLVEETRLLDERRFVHALQFCMLLPGPEAMQLVTYAGWALRGPGAGLAAGLIFIAPGFLSVLALSLGYLAAAGLPTAASLLYGLAPAALALVVASLRRLAARVLPRRGSRLLALAALLATLVGVPFPALVVAAGALGALLGARAEPVEAAAPDGPLRPSLGGTLRSAAIGLLAWLAPLVLVAALLGPEHRLARIGWFFGQVACFSFGGAYAALAYVADVAVDPLGWLTAKKMLDGLSLAETTPGPLIQVVQFVGTLAAARAPDPLGAWPAALLGALVTTWATFAPSFLFVFVGAPYIEALHRVPRLSAALAAISAAVVGVLAHLALWFAAHTLFAAHTRRVDAGVALSLPDPASVDPWRLALALAAGVALLRGVGPLRVLAATAIAGAAIDLASRT